MPEENIGPSEGLPLAAMVHRLSLSGTEALFSPAL